MRRRLLAGLALLAWVWLAAGVRRVGDDRFGVIDGPALAGGARSVDAGWTLAPRPLLRLTTYPRDAVELPLPGAERAGFRAADGSRFGLGGWVELQTRPEQWRELHAAAHGAGLRGVLLDAAREAAPALGTRDSRSAVTAAARGRFESALSAALDARGVELRELRLEALDSAVGQGGGDSGARVLVIGLDGADWQILDPLLEAGRLPNLRGLVERGTRARLLSISPLLSPVVWTSVATGVEPTRHGVLDFLVSDASGTAQPVTSAQRRVPTVWEMLSRKGIEVGVVGWWATWPADPVRGYLVADRVAYQLFGYRSDPTAARGKSWPPDLYSDVRPLVVEPSSVGWSEVRPYLDGAHEREEQYPPDERELLDEFRTLLASGRTYLGIAEQMRTRFRPRLEVVYFEGTDTVGHLFMPYRPPRLPGVSDERAAAFSHVVDRYYETIDGYVGRLLAGREDWTVLVVSDHGFATGAGRPRTTDSRIGHGAAADWHRRFGVLIVSGAHARPGRSIDEATIYDIAPTILALFGEPVPRSWPGRVVSEALDERFVETHPVRYRADDPQRGAGSQVAADPAAEDLIAKLRSLGYVGTAGEGDSRSARNNAGVSLLAQGRYAEAEREFRAGLEDGRPAMPILMVNLALSLRLQGKGEPAAELFERALGFEATRRMAANELALLRLDEGRLDEAEGAARDALRLEPDAAELHNSLGLVLEARGDLARAAEEYRRSAALNSDSAMSRNNLGNLSKDRGDLADAERWYLRAIEADPYFMGSYNNLALVYQAQGQIDRAIDLYDRALGKAPGNAVVLNNLGSLYFASREYDRAREAWERAVEAEPDYASPWNNLAGLAITLGGYDEAETRLARALQIDPGYGDARINRSLVLRARGRLDEARRELQQAAQDPRAAAGAWRQLGSLELSAGRVAEGLEAWRRSLAIDPRQAGLRAEVERLSSAR